MAQEIGLDRPVVKPADDDDRSIAEIRHNIEQARQNITGTVDLLGEKLQRQLDWREYARERPELAIGIGLGVGFLLSRMVVRRPEPTHGLSDLVSETLAKTIRRVFQPRPESILTKLVKMAGGIAVAQLTQTLQTAQREEEPQYRQYAAESGYAPRQ